MAVVIDCPLGRDHRPRASHDGGFFHMKARERDRGGQRWWKYARHRRQIADAAVDDAEQRDDRGLVGGDGIEIADDRLL